MHDTSRGRSSVRFCSVFRTQLSCQYELFSGHAKSGDTRHHTLRKELFFAVHPPTTWEGDTSAYLEFFRVEYWVQRLSEHIGDSNVSGMAPGTFVGSVYTLRTFPLDGWGCVQIRS